MSLPATTSNSLAENVLPRQPILEQQFNINQNYIQVPASNFGYIDSQPSSPGKWMADTSSPTIVGASLPVRTTQALFGTVDNAKNNLIEIHNTTTDKTIIAPLIDTGPSKESKYGIDLSYSSFVQLGGKPNIQNGTIVGGDDLSSVHYRVLTPEEQQQYQSLVDGNQGSAHNIPAPLRDISKSVDLTQGVNTQRDSAVQQLAGGQIPDYSSMVESSTQGTQGEAGAETNIIHTTTNITPNPINTSGMPSGMFSIPEVGSMLWVFFRNGDPQFPVYFAASYGQNEWAAAYSASSPPMYYPGTDPKKLSKSDAAYMIPNKGGGIQCIERVSNTGNLRSMKLFGYSGAHLEFNEEHNIYYAPHDDYHQADGNKFDLVHSNREVLTRGDSNKVTLGDHYVKIGNMSQSAIEAIDHINEIINNVNNAMLGEPGSPTSGGSAATTPNMQAMGLSQPNSNNELQAQNDQITDIPKYTPPPVSLDTSTRTTTKPDGTISTTTTNTTETINPKTGEIKVETQDVTKVYKDAYVTPTEELQINPAKNVSTESNNTKVEQPKGMIQREQELKADFAKRKINSINDLPIAERDALYKELSPKSMTAAAGAKVAARQLNIMIATSQLPKNQVNSAAETTPVSNLDTITQQEQQSEILKRSVNQDIMIKDKVNIYTQANNTQKEWMDSNARSQGFTNYIEYTKSLKT